MKARSQCAADSGTENSKCSLLRLTGTEVDSLVDCGRHCPRLRMQTESDNIIS